MLTQPEQVSGQVAAPPPRGYIRWYICGLLFFATTVNYVDRQVLGILKPVLEKELHWDETDYSTLITAFQAAYALMMPIAGRLIDRLGTRVGYALAVFVWSAFSMSHSLARTSWQFAISRFGLGIGEAANFPAAIRTVADWFPPQDRALATGIFNSGSNIGAIVAPLLVPFVATHLGWRASFLVVGGLDVIWLIVWLLTYRKPAEFKRLSKAEYAYIQSGERPDPPVAIPYSHLLTKKSAWAFVLGKFLTDPVWWFYLFWIPGYLSKQYGLDLTHLGVPLVIIYLAADIGSIGGGWLPSLLTKRGWSVNKARKAAMLICAIAVTPVILLAFPATLWSAVFALSMATAAHQGWSANLFTIPSDTFPRKAVASVVGLGGLGGAIGGMLVSPAIGAWLQFSHGTYAPLFMVAGLMYLIAFGIIQVLVPRLQQPAEI